jgi:hypothetical protein
MTAQRPSDIRPNREPDPDDHRVDVTEGEVGFASLKEPSEVAPPDSSRALPQVEDDDADHGGRGS